MLKNTKIFFKKNWSLILVLIYFIAPDLIPGFLDDIALIVVERTVHSYLNNKEKSKNNNK